MWEEERWWWEVCVCVREGRREREKEKLPSLFPQHQLCGFYEEQMFTTWYSASSPSTHYLQCQHHQLSANTHKHALRHTHKHKQTHTHTHTHIVSWERQSYIAATFSYECVGVYSPAYWGHFTVCFPLCSGCVSCSWVNTWYNQVSLPPLSVCTSVGQLWPWAQRSYSARQSGQRKQMRALTIPLSKQKLIVQKWVVLKSSCSLVKVSHALCSLSICRFSSGTYKQRILGAISLRFNPISLVLLHLLGYVIWAWSLEAIFCLAQKTKPVSIWSI